MQPCLIALDWGTTSLRAYLMARDGTILRQQAGGRGIMQVDNGRFEAALQEMAGEWLRDFPHLPLIASGMVGSKQGWREAPYCACPASVDAIASRIVVLEFGNGQRLHIVPGLAHTDISSGVPDVMRGEETQIIGAVSDRGEHLVILPGTHSKWAKVVDGSIIAFSTWMTGEVYAALTQHTILGRLMDLAAPHDDDAFGKGVRGALADPGALLHHIFSARTLGLFNQLGAAALPSYLSGLLIGSEIGGALASMGVAATGSTGAPTLLGSPQLVRSYQAALGIAGMSSVEGAADCAASGLMALAGKAHLV